MKLLIGKLPVIGVFISVLALAFSATASAHVTVKPAEVVTAGFQTFTVSVPNEKDIPTTSIKLVMPSGLEHVSPTQKAGWQIDIEKEGEGESAVVKSITWSGSTVGAGFRDDFTFSAKVPDNAAELQWKAYQAYSDGTGVSWDKADEGEHGELAANSGPFSVTKVVAETVQDAAVKKTEQAAVDAKNSANTALYAAVAGVTIGLLGVYLATRRK